MTTLASREIVRAILGLPGWTPERLATRLRVSVPCIRNWRLGRGKPHHVNREALDRLFRRLGLE